MTQKKPTIEELHKRFYAAYRELRDAWIATGGGMDLELTIRDTSAEASFQRRSAAAKRGREKRGNR